MITLVVLGSAANEVDRRTPLRRSYPTAEGRRR